MKNRYTGDICCHELSPHCKELGNGIHVKVNILTLNGISMDDLLFTLCFYSYGTRRTVRVRKDQMLVRNGAYYALLNEKHFSEGWLACDVEILEPCVGWPHNLRPVTVKCITPIPIGGCAESFSYPCDCEYHDGKEYTNGYNITFEKVDELPEEESGGSGSYDDTELKKQIKEVGNSLEAHIEDTQIHITDEEREKWNQGIGGGGGESYAADEEDITLAQNSDGTGKVYQFKNRDTSKGMGYIILRSNKTLAEQITEENTIYEIRYDFDLGEETLQIPANCVLDFKGGSFNNGTLVGNNTSITSALTPILNVNLTGTWLGEGHIIWFGADISNEDNSEAIQRCMDAFDTTIIDVGTYKVTKTLIGSKSSVIKGSSNIYSNNRISFIPESDDVTTLFSLPNGTVQYYVIEGIRLMGNKAATVEGAKWKSGTVCINITSGANINLRHCMIFGFAKGLVSNFNSYYNNIDHCRFDSVHTCLDSFSPNNLTVTNTRVQNFCNFIYRLSGSGPLTIDKCAFEVFSGWILFSYYICQKVNFTNNYVEPRREVLPPLFSDKNNGRFGGNVLFEGNFNNFYSTGNEFQVNDSKKVYIFNMIESFVSKGNKLFISSNSCNLQSYLELTYNEHPEVEATPVRVFTLEDSCVYFTSSSVIYTQNYTQFSKIENATATGVYKGFDPVTNIGIIPIIYSNISVEAGSGYLFDEDRPPSYIVQNNIMYLQGHIIRNLEDYSEPLEFVGTLLGKTSFGNMGNKHPYCYIQAFDDESYAPVILKYTYADRTLSFVHGDNSKGIILDGSYIPIRR